MKLELFPMEFTVCQVKKMPDVLPDLCFVGKTDQELSLACPTEFVPGKTTACEDGWRCFRFVGVLDFSLVGILARLAGILAEIGVSIFAVSTFDTDYILVKAVDLDRVISVLEEQGYSFVPL